MKCAHTGDLQVRYPEGTEMRRICLHTSHCDVCGWGWDCIIEDCIGFPREIKKSLQNEIETLLEGIEW